MQSVSIFLLACVLRKLKSPVITICDIHCLDRTPDCTFWTRIVASKMETEKQARGRCQLFIIYKCYSELFTSIDRTYERNIDFLN